MPLFYVKTCPLADECSAAAWKKAWVKSYESEQECRDQLPAHLMRSSLHENHVMGELTDLCESTTVEVWHDKATCKAPHPPSTPPPVAGRASTSSNATEDGVVMLERESVKRLKKCVEVMEKSATICESAVVAFRQQANELQDAIDAISAATTPRR